MDHYNSRGCTTLVDNSKHQIKFRGKDLEVRREGLEENIWSLVCGIWSLVFGLRQPLTVWP